jgi:transposase-like protein
MPYFLLFVKFTTLLSFCFMSLYRVRQKYLTIWQHSCEWNCWCGEFFFERPSCKTQSISAAMEHWSVEHRAFAVEMYLKNNNSVILPQWIFCQPFNIHWNDSVPSRNTILLWVRNFRETASTEEENLQEESLHLELLRTLSECIRLLSEILGDEQVEMPLL